MNGKFSIYPFAPQQSYVIAVRHIPCHSLPGRRFASSNAPCFLPLHFPSSDPGRVAVPHRRAQLLRRSRRGDAEHSPRAGDGLAVPAAPGHDLPKQLRAAQDGDSDGCQRGCRRERHAGSRGDGWDHQFGGRFRTSEADSVRTETEVWRAFAHAVDQLRVVGTECRQDFSGVRDRIATWSRWTGFSQSTRRRYVGFGRGLNGRDR